MLLSRRGSSILCPLHGFITLVWYSLRIFVECIVLAVYNLNDLFLCSGFSNPVNVLLSLRMSARVLLEFKNL